MHSCGKMLQIDAIMNYDVKNVKIATFFVKWHFQQYLPFLQFPKLTYQVLLTNQDNCLEIIHHQDQVTHQTAVAASLMELPFCQR